MKAIRVHQFGGPEVMTLEQLPDPRPGPSQILIRVRAIGVNPVETYLRSGSNPSLTLPYTPGTDAAGEVLAAGDSVRGWPPGARVYTSGTLTGAYAGLTLCEASCIHPLPGKISFAQGAAVNIPGATAWRALFQRARAVPGETVLIHGASGGVGNAAIQLARAAGLNIIATAGTPAGAELVRQLGAHHVLDHHTPDYLKQITALTAGRGPEIILEMLANMNLAKDLSILATNGRVIVIGNRGKIEIDPRETMKRDAEIRGMMLFIASEKDKLAIHSALGAALESGVLKPVIACELPLSQAPRAHQQILQPGARGKIILIPEA
jgi:NADPH2:quinone reductase